MPVRSTSAAVRQHLADGLPRSHDPDLVELPQGLGVRPADDGSAFHWLYWGRCPVVRTRDADRLVNALEQHLSIPAAAPEGHVLMTLAAGVDAAGRAFLLPRLGAEVARFDRRLRDVGATLCDGPYVTVDVVSGEMVVDVPERRITTAARSRLLDTLGTTFAEPHLEPGRYPLDRWLVEGPEGASGAAALAAMLASLAAPTTPQSALAARDLLDRLRRVVITMRDVSTVVAGARPEAN